MRARVLGIIGDTTGNFHLVHPPDIHASLCVGSPSFVHMPGFESPSRYFSFKIETHRVVLLACYILVAVVRCVDGHLIWKVLSWWFYRVRALRGKVVLDIAEMAEMSQVRGCNCESIFWIWFNGTRQPNTDVQHACQKKKNCDPSFRIICRQFPELRKWRRVFLYLVTVAQSRRTFSASN